MITDTPRVASLCYLTLVANVIDILSQSCFEFGKDYNHDLDNISEVHNFSTLILM